MSADAPPRDQPADPSRTGPWGGVSDDGPAAHNVFYAREINSLARPAEKCKTDELDHLGQPRTRRLPTWLTWFASRPAVLCAVTAFSVGCWLLFFAPVIGGGLLGLSALMLLLGFAGRPWHR